MSGPAGPDGQRQAPTTARPALRARPLRTGPWSLRYDPRALLVCAGLLLAPRRCTSSWSAPGLRLSPLEVVRTLTGTATRARIHRPQLGCRAPLVALLVGAALGMAGAAFQTVYPQSARQPRRHRLRQGSAAGALS